MKIDLLTTLGGRRHPWGGVRLFFASLIKGAHPRIPKESAMPYDAKSIANFFIDRAKESGETLTQMKLHKLIYYAHGWHLALTGEPLIDEPVQAWNYAL